ncbi:hypothetical protein OV090_10920 [Nannocystis sp. RBIL2]|uniref:hypothetical protein n=1 Tax=Nannocystis sp. RBIL2 TaxID=2996788 RepID=UPI00226D6398|nr:hypothetical protein [Nannocystis sp. RBIL2]MCY1065276.1 hypothetical protein [Nannocystis sp. RBIL2]
MNTTRRLSPGLILSCAAFLALAGCSSKPTKGEFREKNRAAIEAAKKSFAEMKRIVEATPSPEVNGACARPGLVAIDSKSAVAPRGDAVTEQLDAWYFESLASAPPPGSLVDGEGPLLRVVEEADVGNDEVSLSMPVDPEFEQRKLDAASAVRFVLVTRKTQRGADVFLFEHPKATLVCSFALDVEAGGQTVEDLKFIDDNGYDPHTGAPADRSTAARSTGGDAKIETLHAEALAQRFGIGNVAPSRPADDPRVKERAAKVVKALEATIDLPECTPDAVGKGIRMNEKELRILAGGPLLLRADPDVQINPNSSTTTASYLRGRDKASADALADAAVWHVVDLQKGGVATSLDGKTFNGGWANGNLVVLDKDGKATCRKPVSIAPPDQLQVMVKNPQAPGISDNDAGSVSASQLRTQIDELLGAP